MKITVVLSSSSMVFQAPYNLRIMFQSEILDAANQAAELLRSLGKDICNMKQSLKVSLLKSVHSSTERLQCAIDMHSYLLTARCDPPLPHDNSSKPLLKLSHAVSSTPYNLQLDDLDDASIEKSLNQLTQLKSYHEVMSKQPLRLHSWPSREVDACCFSTDSVLPRMRALESTSALSLITFTSLLIEFVARVYHLVDELSKLAKFKA